MPILTLDSDSYAPIEFKIPRPKHVEFTVEAETAVNTFLVDIGGLRDFERGAYEFFSYGGRSRRRKHEDEIYLPEGGIYYLIIQNELSYSVAIYFEIFTW